MRKNTINRCLPVILCGLMLNGCAVSKETIEQSLAANSALKEATGENAERTIVEGCQDLEWPASGIATLLPVVSAPYGNSMIESSTMFTVSLYNVKSKDFSEYVSACQEKGFNVDEALTSATFSAKNEDGYELNLFYIADDQNLHINLSAPEGVEFEEEEDGDTGSSQSVISSPLFEEEDDTEEDDASEAEQSDSAADSRSNNSVVVEPDDEEDDEDIPLAPSATTSMPTILDGTDSTENIRTSVKEAIDAYKEVWLSLADFMEEYNARNKPVSMLKDYVSLLETCQEAEDKMDAMEDDWSAEELYYFIQAQNEINERLFEFGTSIETIDA